LSQRTIAVVDGNSLIHRAFHALPESMTAPDGRPTNAAFGFVSMLVKMIQELKPDGVVAAFDAGKPAFRTEALEQYKMHRPPTPDALRAQFPMVLHLLEALDVPIVQIQGWEADDILGTLAKAGEREGVHVLLVTGDRDVFQLVSDSVQVVTTKKGLTDIAVYGPAEVEARYGVTPAQVPDYLGLKGDTSDNIPGVPGIGEKTAAKLLQEHGTLEGVLEAAEDMPGKVGENLRAHTGEALASRTVATIACDVPVDINLASVRWGDFDPVRVAEAFGELRFTSLRERVLALADMHVPASVSGATTPVSTSRAPGGEAIAPPPNAEAAATSVQPGAPCTVVTGENAAEAVAEWASSDLGWLGVALVEGGESLFDTHADLAVSTEGAVAVVPPDAAVVSLAGLLREADIAAGDVKSLLEALCPPRESEGCDISFDAAEPERLFDCAIAAYLLESNRSSYDLPGLSSDYLRQPLSHLPDEAPAAALQANAARLLALELEERLAEDGSTEVLRTIEMPLVPVLARMERVGVGLDTEVLSGIGEEAAGQIDQLRQEIWDLAGTEFTIDSPKQLSEVLFDKLGLPPQKKIKTGYSTDSSVLQALSAAHPVADKILAYRELTKLKSTYIDALPRLIAEDGRLHTSFNQTVAATGRLSSSNPNLQNIPVRTELGRRIRAAFVPAEHGDVIVSADYSQIELRILAHLSADQGLIDAFTSGEDFHAATAARVFGLEPGQVDPGSRSRAKAVNFGIVYGQSAHGLAESLGIGRAEAQAMIDRYYAAFPGVRRFLDESVANAYRDGFSATMFGRKRRMPELKSSNYNVRAFGERTAMNHPMQGTAADIMKLAMIEVDRRLRAEGFGSRMVLQVHDELVFEAPAAEVDTLAAMAKDAMGGVVEMAVPLDVSVSSGPNWAAAK
jgi:DNA polymerase-1